MRKAVIFDMDGTLFDSEVLVIECWEVVAQKYHIKDIKDACMQCLGVNAKKAKDTFHKIYGDHFPYDDYKKEMSELYHKKAAEGQLILKPGVLELLKYLKWNNRINNIDKYLTAVASSTRESVVRSELELTGISSYFDVIVGGNQVQNSKPEPDIFLLAAKLLHVESKDCIVIEDSYNGIRAAYKAGMTPIMVPDIIKANDEMYSLSKKVCSSLFEVKAYFEYID